MREVIFENEKRGIQPQISWTVRRYYSDAFKNKQQRTVYQNDRYNNDNGLGRGDSEKISGTDEGIIQRAR